MTAYRPSRPGTPEGGYSSHAQNVGAEMGSRYPNLTRKIAAAKADTERSKIFDDNTPIQTDISAFAALTQGELRLFDSFSRWSDGIEHDRALTPARVSRRLNKVSERIGSISVENSILILSQATLLEKLPHKETGNVTLLTRNALAEATLTAKYGRIAAAEILDIPEATISSRLRESVQQTEMVNLSTLTRAIFSRGMLES